MRDIEQKRAGSLLHIDGVFACHAKPHIVLGAEDVCDPAEHFRLMLLHPQQLGEGEIRKAGLQVSSIRRSYPIFWCNQSHCG